ncbi:hypothetical protein BGW37DRAFT_480235 [Umbelopsis sp. PMI_123]|nr:hypothetical protein BGW37DRAFT_480235 [Umbelopsis sp. PMI_123]
MDSHSQQPNLDPSTLQELESLRIKLQSLQDTFNTHLAYLRDPKYPFTWPDLLNKFNMLTAKFASLSEDFYAQLDPNSNSTLPKLMLHPQTPTTTESETQILSVLLRTKLIPDIERMEAQIQVAVATEFGEPDGNDGSGKAVDEDRVLRKQQEHWTKLINRHDQLAGQANEIVNELVANFRETNIAEAEQLERQRRELVAVEPAWKKEGFTNEEIWRRYQLECMASFFSSGQDELQGSDLKKLAQSSQPAATSPR